MCLLVCHNSVFCQNVWMDRAGFDMEASVDLTYTLCCNSAKTKVRSVFTSLIYSA